MMERRKEREEGWQELARDAMQMQKRELEAQRMLQHGELDAASPTAALSISYCISGGVGASGSSSPLHCPF